MKITELVITKTETKTVTRVRPPTGTQDILNPDRIALQAAIIETENRIRAEIAKRKMYRDRAKKAAETRKANALAARYRERALKAAATRKANRIRKEKEAAKLPKKKKAKKRICVCGEYSCKVGPFQLV